MKKITENYRKSGDLSRDLWHISRDFPRPELRGNITVMAPAKAVTATLYTIAQHYESAISPSRMMQLLKCYALNTIAWRYESPFIWPSSSSKDVSCSSSPLNCLSYSGFSTLPPPAVRPRRLGLRFNPSQYGGMPCCDIERWSGGGCAGAGRTPRGDHVLILEGRDHLVGRRELDCGDRRVVWCARAQLGE